MAIDLRSAYDTKVKPRAAVAGDPLRAKMTARLSEMYKEYGIQGTKVMANLTLPVATTDLSKVPGVSGGKTLWDASTRTPGV